MENKLQDASDKIVSAICDSLIKNHDEWEPFGDVLCGEASMKNKRTGITLKTNPIGPFLIDDITVPQIDRQRIGLHLSHWVARSLSMKADALLIHTNL